MEEIRVTRKGLALWALDEDSEKKLSGFPVGQVLKARVTRPRSQQHNAFFHVFITEVYDNWPQTHKFQPHDMQHLRAWLLCKANHCQKMVVTINSEERHILTPLIKAFQSFFESDKERYTFVGIKDGALIAMRPLSLKYDDVDQHWFQPIAEEVFHIIEEETGLKADDHHKAWQERNGRKPE